MNKCVHLHSLLIIFALFTLFFLKSGYTINQKSGDKAVSTKQVTMVVNHISL